MDEDENVDLVSNEEDDLEESIIYRTYRMDFQNNRYAGSSDPEVCGRHSDGKSGTERQYRRRNIPPGNIRSRRRGRATRQYEYLENSLVEKNFKK